MDGLLNTLKLVHKMSVKLKQYHYKPGETLKFPEVGASQISRQSLIKFVKLSALGTGRLYLQEIFLVLISVRG
jgi:hypothetical protein